MSSHPGLAAIKNTIAEIPIKAPLSHFGYFNFEIFCMDFSIERGRKTDPRYEIRFAQRAASSVFDKDKVR